MGKQNIFIIINLKNKINSTTSRKLIHINLFAMELHIVEQSRIRSSNSMKTYLWLLEKAEYHIKILIAYTELTFVCCPLKQNWF